MAAEARTKRPRSTSTPTQALLVAIACALVGCVDDDPLAEVTFVLRAAETRLDFGDVPIGGFVERSTFLLNEGTGAIALDGPLVVEGAASDAYVVVDGGDFPLGPNAFTEVRVRFTPTSEGRGEASVLARGVVADVDTRITLVGNGIAPAVTLAPAELDFGDVAAGATSTATLTVGNDGDAPLSVRLVIEGRAFSFDDGSNARRVDVGVGATLALEMRFSPDGGGPFTARVYAETCGSSCGPSVALVGHGIAPRIDIAPRPIALGEVLEGTEKREPVTVKNIGVGVLVISAVSLVDALGAMRIEHPALPLVLDSGAEATLEVVYAPPAPEANYVATLLVDSSDPLQERVSVPISATTPGARLRVIPAAVHFGIVDAGQSRSADVVALSTGTVPITLSTAYVIGPAFLLSALPPSLPSALAPGESVLFTVTAQGAPDAVAAGGASGQFIVETDDGEVVTTALTFASGTDGCQPRAATENLNLGFVRIGQGANGTILVDNIGTSACTLTSAGPRLGLAYDAGFSHAAPVAHLPAGGQIPLLVAYQASIVGQAKAFIDLRFAEQPAPLLVSSTATGVDGAMSAVPPSIALGPVIVGCSLPDERTVSFINDGSNPVLVLSLALDPPTTAATFTGPLLPISVPPGGFLNVTVRTTGLAAGLVSTSLVAHTEELGPVTAVVSVETTASGLPVTETFVVADVEGKVDILFVVDNSGSMGDDQEILTNNFATFIASAAANGSSDFQIGVTSTDVEIEYGGLAGRLNGNPAVLRPSTPNLIDTFAAHASLGTQGSGYELGLEAMRLALSEPLASTTNAGFHRPNAALSIIVVSDEDDSGGYELDGGSYPLANYEAFLDALKGGVLTEAPVLFNAVIDTNYSPRYQAMVTRYGGVALDISSPNWGTELSQIADATFALQRLFRLTTPAQPGTATVTIDGSPVTAFTVDENGNIKLDAAPPAASIVEITYVPAC
jgi:hypothetical protein